MSKEYNVDPIETKEEKCETCNKGLNISQKWLIAFSIYMLVSSIYGTIELIKSLISLF